MNFLGIHQWVTIYRFSTALSSCFTILVFAVYSTVGRSFIRKATFCAKKYWLQKHFMLVNHRPTCYSNFIQYRPSVIDLYSIIHWIFRCMFLRAHLIIFSFSNEMFYVNITFLTVNCWYRRTATDYWSVIRLFKLIGILLLLFLTFQYRFVW